MQLKIRGGVVMKIYAKYAVALVIGCAVIILLSFCLYNVGR